jgi:hypothetical protein
MREGIRRALAVGRPIEVRSVTGRSFSDDELRQMDLP